MNEPIPSHECPSPSPSPLALTTRRTTPSRLAVGVAVGLLAMASSACVADDGTGGGNEQEPTSQARSADTAGDVANTLIDLATLCAGAATANAAVGTIGVLKLSKDFYSISGDFNGNQGSAASASASADAVLAQQLAAVQKDVVSLQEQVDTMKSIVIEDVDVLEQFDSNIEAANFITAAEDLSANASQIGKLTPYSGSWAILGHDKRKVENMLLALEGLVINPPPSASNTTQADAIATYALGIKIRTEYALAGWPMDRGWLAARWTVLKQALAAYKALTDPSTQGYSELRAFADWLFPFVRAVETPYPLFRGVVSPGPVSLSLLEHDPLSGNVSLAWVDLNGRSPTLGGVQQLSTVPPGSWIDVPIQPVTGDPQVAIQSADVESPVETVWTVSTYVESVNAQVPVPVQSDDLPPFDPYFRVGYGPIPWFRWQPGDLVLGLNHGSIGVTTVWADDVNPASMVAESAYPQPFAEPSYAAVPGALVDVDVPPAWPTGPKPAVCPGCSLVLAQGVGDFNGDGVLDLVYQDLSSNAVSFCLSSSVSDYGNPPVKVLMCKAPGASSDLRNFPSLTPASVATDASVTIRPISAVVGVADVDGDGRPDLIVQEPATSPCTGVLDLGPCGQRPSLGVWFMDGTTVEQTEDLQCHRWTCGAGMCGTQSDGCGGTVDCGNPCGAGQVCGNLGTCVCGPHAPCRTPLVWNSVDCACEVQKTGGCRGNTCQ